MRSVASGFAALAVLGVVGCADADEAPAAGAAEAAVVRVPLPDGSTFPIASAVATSAEATLVYHSGIVPVPKDETAPFRSRAYW
ncbi:MAG: hypothetical protein JXB36_00120, partial [Gammaproteobacteria bacterium]|nr:hypothetical protein [Gammaproteobacteria bacterium]